MSTAAPRASEVSAFGEALTAVGSVRIDLDGLWRLWAATAPRLVGDPDQTAVLDAVLRELAVSGLIELPVGSWDRTTVPPLPRFINVPIARKVRGTKPWRSFPWRGQLGWVSSLPALSEQVFHDLVAINDWLGRTEHSAVPVVPVRYRSAEIFGKEKRLDELSRGSTFGPGRLSFELLACVRIPPPLPAAQVGDGADLLVVENSDTYWVAVEQLRHSSDHDVGLVAWGSGKSFPAQVISLGVDVAGRGPVTGAIWYWGDFDPPGLAIASAAAAMSTDLLIRPAVGLWEAMSGLPPQDAGEVDWSNAGGRDWLGPDLWNQLVAIRNASGRLAQEAVPPATVLRWAIDLRRGQR
ncbi:hypothetical protein [Saccharothrix variisporea]|uniref:Wadjet protein JetD C-terminal domain-containing protein n=1 Tax=Saccharothrix variisporea TaxID=543527 RepID=A0A495XKN9_9PSEU|nr:hypothetical protein [Saccharothrix variisporea]RKT74452.1 hypothetical protein DFJ66_7811 [Saccharothrix variisporea]